jgi:hypothetical protein
MSTAANNALVVTLDIDWAPDFMIDETAQILIDAGVRATWFITHASAAVDRLKSRPDLFELGVHPNFFARSSHGATTQDVLDHCRALVPRACSLRTHGLVQSTPILDAAIASGLTIDVSLYVPYATDLAPVEYWRGPRRLWRVPYMWEVDFEMDRPRPQWTVRALTGLQGLKVMDFHPIHVWLNGADMSAYAALKRCGPKLEAATRADAEPLRRTGAGPGQMFREVVQHLAASGASWRIRDLLPAAAEVAA